MILSANHVQSTMCAENLNLLSFFIVERYFVKISQS